MGELLSNLRVAAPCSADWNQMAGDDRIRHCSQCNLNVYNLSAMTTCEAEELVSRREGRTCVRFYQRKDGTMLTQNCPVGWKIVVRKISRVAGIALSVMATIPIAAEIQPVIQGQAVEGDTGLDLEVIDVSGAACAGAKIDLSRAGSHEAITATTNDKGALHLAHLSPGTYELTVTFPRFEPQIQTVVLRERKPSVLRTTLQVAATMGEIIQVDSPVIDTPSLLLAPVPVRKQRSNPRGFFRRAFGRLFHPSN
ncbi:MAG TPA: carboxypeptidase-like regulatory domain-containing protein [Candidatus Angelobacter sp.]|jgi:hypothetical protein